jgi:glutathione S-transferase
MTLKLHGYQPSVYARIARMTCLEKGVAYEWCEVNPFDAHMPVTYLSLHPFRRVPALQHDGFVLYETGVITRYIDEAFVGPALQPVEPRSRARMAQIEAYGYWPMVRQVFSHRVFGPRMGRAVDEGTVAAGIAASREVLGALEELAGGAGFLVGAGLSLADLHLAPMMAYFTAADEGQEVLADFPRLSAWWASIRQRQSLQATDPGLPA